MPVHAIDPLPAPGDFRAGTLGVWLDRNDRRTVDIAAVRTAMLANQRNNPALVAAAVQQALQGALDVRIARASLPLDDPDLLTDPARPDLFWDGLDLVGRSVVVSFTWTGTDWRLELRQA